MMKDQNTKVPILFLVFNRPEQTRQVFERIRSYKPNQLFIAADGARHDADHERCNEVKRIVKQVDWDCDVRYLFREKNLGCRIAVKTSIDWFFEHVEMGIILEDDCLPHEHFFDFCRINLEKYKDDTRFGLVSGNNFQKGEHSNYSVFYSRYNSIWGWGTWRRAWSKYLEDAGTARDQDIIYNLSKHFRGDELAYRLYNFRGAYEGRINTWDYQWHLTCLVNNFLTILPKSNLISNIGFDEHATHTKRGVTLASTEIDLNSLTYPDFIYFNQAYEDLFRISFGPIRKLRRIFGPKIKKWLNLDKR